MGRVAVLHLEDVTGVLTDSIETAVTPLDASTRTRNICMNAKTPKALWMTSDTVCAMTGNE